MLSSVLRHAPLVVCCWVSLCFLIYSAEARYEFNFTQCGGARSCLGASRLERLRRRSGSIHRSQEEIAQELDGDHDLGVDVTNDMLIYSCSALHASPPAGRREEDERDKRRQRHHRSLKGFLPAAAVANAEIASGWLPNMPDVMISMAEAFSLHSRPNATRKILLDFDGHVTTGTAWNTRNGQAVITTPPYDKDGNPNSWSATELSDILGIWRAVSEDFAPWDVDVTTEDPGASYLAANGVRVAIGGSYKDWYLSSAGGVAYVGVFGKYNGYYSPAFIFAKDLGLYPKYVWEAASHEVGHTCGLSHDGQAAGGAVRTATAYYEGQGSWAPIMGASYYKPVTQWSRGEYTNANNREDDLVIMSTFLGSVTAIPEEHGNTTATATLLQGVPDASNLSATARADGIIRQSTSLEVFTFNMVFTGNVTLQLLGAALWGAVPRSNLNATATLANAQGQLLGTVVGVGTGPVSVVLPAGVYYITVSPTGSADPITTGYSSYASLGQYQLVVTLPLKLVQLTSGALGGSSNPAPQPKFEPRPQPNTQPKPKLEPESKPKDEPNAQPNPGPKSNSNSKSDPKSQSIPITFAIAKLAPPANMMNLSSVVVAKSVRNSKVTCTAVVTVALSVNGTKVARVSVQGTWTSVLSASGWPITTATASTGASGTSLGVVTFTASRTLPAAAGNGCTFTVTSWSKPGMLQDSTAVPGPFTLTW